MADEDKAWLSDIKLQELYAESEGNASIKLALIDGPVDAGHCGFKGTTLKQSGKEESCWATDSPACRHGTFVAGIVGAGRETPAPAICPGCSVIVRPIFCQAQDLEQCPLITADDLADTLREVMDEGASIVNMSVGMTDKAETKTDKLFKVYDEARQRNVLLVGAGGNQASMDVNPLFRHPWVIPVAACGRNGVIEPSSNIGTWMSQHGLLAPGTDITSTSSGGGYRQMSGTSVAAPFVSGTLALLWSRFPEATAEELHNAILRKDVKRSSVLPLMLDAEASLQHLKSTRRMKTNMSNEEVWESMSEQPVEQAPLIDEACLSMQSNDAGHESTEAQVIPQACSCGGLGGGCSCGGMDNMPPSYIYAVGELKPVFPTLDLQKEFESAAKALQVSEKDYYGVFSTEGQPYMYIAEQTRWILSINNIDAYLIVPRSQLELNDIINALKPPSNTIEKSMTVIIGQKGPMAPPDFCKGLQLPIVVCSQLYFFTLDQLMSGLNSGDIDAEVISDVINSLEFKPNDGASAKDRAVNYLAFRYPEIYRKTASLKNPPANSGAESQSLVNITTKPSDISTGRTIIDVIFKFQSNSSGALSYWYCGVDTTGQFPFLSSPIQTYVPIS